MSHKIFVFVPAFGQTITATTFLTTHALQQWLGSRGIGAGISTLSFPDIGELRNMATTIWYDCLDATHLLFIDADMGFSPDVIADMLTLGEPLVGCIYPQRRLPLSWAGSGTGEAMAERRGNFMRVEGVGMGCTLIHRSVIKAIMDKYPELEDKRIELHPAKETLKNAGTQRILRVFDPIDIPDRGKVSEDLSFCIRAGQAGIPCWAAIGHRISHVGPYDYGARYLDSVEAAQKAAEAEAAGATDAQVEAIAQAVQTAVAMAEAQASAA